MVRWQIAWAAACVVPAFAETAGAQTYDVYDCAFLVRGFGGEEIRLPIAVDADGKAYTFDTKPGSDRPVRVPVSSRADGPGHFIFKYSFNVQNNAIGTARVDLQARVPRAGGASRISVSARRFSDKPTGEGTCPLRKDVRLAN